MGCRAACHYSHATQQRTATALKEGPRRQPKATTIFKSIRHEMQLLPRRQPSVGAFFLCVLRSVHAPFFIIKMTSSAYVASASSYQDNSRHQCDNQRMEWIVVTLASLLAGFIDAIVGGGGLILLPALFATFPSAPPATLLGTNKSASVWGTAMATWQYSRRVQIRWEAMLPASAAGFAGAFAGAWAVTVLSPDFLRKLLPLVLVAVLGYTLAKKELGRHHQPRFSGRAEWVAASLIGGTIGFYDGFFGPGTGSFFVFLLVRLLGYDFLNASASAKLLNVATNIAALILFTLKGHVWWHFALPLAVANVVGSVLGTHMALKHGTGFVRGIFIVVVSVLILKTGYDAFLR